MKEQEVEYKDLDEAQCFINGTFKHRVKNINSIKSEEDFFCYDSRSCLLQYFHRGRKYCLGRLESEEEDLK